MRPTTTAASDSAPKLVVSGGSFTSATGAPLVSEAAAARELLVELGVPPDAIVLEERSQTTRENAIESMKIVGAEKRDVKPIASR